MTGLIFGQYWIILFLWVGLAVTRRYISRYPEPGYHFSFGPLLFPYCGIANETQGTGLSLAYLHPNG
jgi:hypothetical protein